MKIYKEAEIDYKKMAMERIRGEAWERVWWRYPEDRDNDCIDSDDHIEDYEQELLELALEYKEMAIKLKDEIQVMKNSVVEAMVRLPNVASYIKQMENDIEQLKKAQEWKCWAKCPKHDSMDTITSMRDEINELEKSIVAKDIGLRAWERQCLEFVNENHELKDKIKKIKEIMG